MTGAVRGLAIDCTAYHLLPTAYRLLPTAVQLLRDLSELPESLQHGAVSIGNFDGVHRGHARIIRRLVSLAREVHGAAIVFTFDPHPAKILRPQVAPVPLCWTERKVRLLGDLGVDAVIAYRTDRAFLQLDARQFFEQIVCGRLAARVMVEGSNFFFGHDRTGNIEVLRRFCDEAGIAIEVIEPLQLDGQVVSSSRVRALVSAGRVDEARALLTEPYRIRGTVVRGAGRGAKLGFPTANLGQIDTLVPAEGIYAGRAWVSEPPYTAAISIGPNPTFGENTPKVEPYLLDYHGDLYGQVIEVDFLARVRNIEKFASVDELVAQMDRDVATTRRIVGQPTPDP